MSPKRILGLYSILYINVRCFKQNDKKKSKKNIYFLNTRKQNFEKF